MDTLKVVGASRAWTVVHCLEQLCFKNCRFFTSSNSSILRFYPSCTDWTVHTLLANCSLLSIDLTEGVTTKLRPQKWCPWTSPHQIYSCPLILPRKKLSLLKANLPRWVCPMNHFTSGAPVFCFHFPFQTFHSHWLFQSVGQPIPTPAPSYMFVSAGVHMSCTHISTDGHLVPSCLKDRSLVYCCLPG